MNLNQKHLRGGVKYYFADFVPSPFTDIPPKNVLEKVLKMVFFAQKTPVFGPKNRLRIWGVPPPPPFTDKIFGKKGVTDLALLDSMVASFVLKFPRGVVLYRIGIGIGNWNWL